MKNKTLIKLLFVWFLIIIGIQLNARIPIILDTDANNELDDQHAIAYMLFSSDIFDVKGITVNYTNVGDIDDHYDEAYRIMRFSEADGIIPLKKGAEGSYLNIKDHVFESAFDGKEAIDFIIDQAHAYDGSQGKLILAPIGKLTNIALAFQKDPSIIDKVRVMWLGSNYNFTDGNDNEFNLVHDPNAYNAVILSGVQFDLVTVRYYDLSGTTAVRVHVDEIRDKMPGIGPYIPEGVVGRTGGTFYHWGDYSIELFEQKTTTTRPLFDVCVLSILKNPSYAQSSVITAPKLCGTTWCGMHEGYNITIWEWFNKEAILSDFFNVMNNPVLVEEKNSQTITFNPITDKFISSPDFTISASASSGLPVSLSIVSGPATISGNTISLNGTAGTVNVKANQYGNDDYYAATPVTQSFNVYDLQTSKITAPIDGESFFAGSDILIEADALTAEGFITKVEFYNGTIKLGEDAMSPYSFTLTNAPGGNYSLTAKALLNDGGSIVSPVVNITVVEIIGECNTIYVDQTINGSQWMPIGAFALTAGTGNSVTISNMGTSNYVIADAVRFSKAGETTIVIDNADSEATINGDWGISSTVSGAINVQYLHDYNTGKGEKSVVYTPTIPSAGEWLIEVNYTSQSNRDKGVPYIVCTAQDQENSAPSVSLTSPSNNSTFTEGSDIIINANALDSDGSITKVEFYYGSSKLGEDVSSPYSYTWSNATIGNYSLTAKATDNDGSSTVSLNVNITVEENEVVVGECNTTLVNQTINGGKWMPLGTYTLSAGTGNTVTISNEGTSNYVIADAVRFIKAGETTIVIDNADSEVTINGDWGLSSSVVGAINVQYLHDYNTGKGEKSVVYTPIIPSAGEWLIEVNYTSQTNRDKAVPYIVCTAQGQENSAPTISLTSPSNSSIFTEGDDIVINANALDSDGSITNVEFYNGSTKLGEDDIEPYSFTWSNAPIGIYSLTAKATDNDGASTVSLIVNVTVEENDIIDGECNTILVNQTINGSQWMPLGTYSLSAGTGNTVTISNEGTSNYVIADAVRFSKAGETTIVIDNADSEVTINGDWGLSSSVKGAINDEYLHDKNSGKGSKSVVYTPNIPSAGDWTIEINYASYSNRDKAVPYIVCSEETSFLKAFTSVESSLEAEEYQSLKSDSELVNIYPTLTFGELNIQGAADSYIEVCNNLGIVVSTLTIKSEREKVYIDLPAGIYFFIVHEFNGNVQQFKIVFY